MLGCGVVNGNFAEIVYYFLIILENIIYNYIINSIFCQVRILK